MKSEGHRIADLELLLERLQLPLSHLVNGLLNIGKFVGLFLYTP